MFKAYRKSQEAQLTWIRQHPVKWVTLNVALIVVFVGYMEYRDRKDMEKWKNENSPHF